MRFQNYIGQVYLVTVFILFVGTSCQQAEKKDNENTSESRPNIIVIMADDLGYSDLGCYGGEINTPNLDHMASDGMRFTQFYNTSRCCPTRASLLTGLYPHEAGIGRMTMDTGKPGYRGFLKDNTVTIAEVLQDAGYQTGMTGKWHVSETERLDKEQQLEWLAHEKDFGPFSDIASYPTSRGFDKFYGTIWGVVDYFDPFSLVYDTTEVKSVPDNYYYTDAITDSTIAFVEQFSKRDDPFFIYMAYTAPHWPLHALPEDIAKYENTYTEGWDGIREHRFQRMIELGILDSSTAKLTPWAFPKFDWEDNPSKEWDSRAMAVHAAMVDRMDQGIGRLMAKLRELKKMDNTLILFMSDNGASYERPSKYGPGFDRAGRTRGGNEVFFPVEKDQLPGPQTVHAGIGPQWAHVSNTPFKYWKSKAYEGGICTPMIAHWPTAIQGKNTINRSSGHVVDIMATAIDLAGAQYPTNHAGHQITPTRGKSLKPLFTGQNREGHEFIFWEHFGSKAIRNDKWKLVQLNKDADWQLFNLETDRTEQVDLAQQYPEKVNELKEKWNELAGETMVFPLP